MKKMVGATGFEPVISRSQSERLTGLGHAPTEIVILVDLFAAVKPNPAIALRDLGKGSRRFRLRAVVPYASIEILVRR